jgi:hypothetical protein
VHQFLVVCAVYPSTWSVCMIIGGRICSRPGVGRSWIYPICCIRLTLLRGQLSCILKHYIRPEANISLLTHRYEQRFPYCTRGTLVDSITRLPVYTENPITLISKHINNVKHFCATYTLIFLLHCETCKEFLVTFTRGYLRLEFALESRVEVPY